MPFPASFDVASIDGTNGVRITSAPADYIAVTATGDFNGDGVADLLISAGGRTAGGAESGGAYVLFGGASGLPTDLSALNGSNGFALNGAPGDYMGYSVAAADVNGDGISDIIISAREADHGGSDTGSVYVVFGQSGAFTPTVSATSLNGANGFRVDGANLSRNTGSMFGSAGDVNGDGFDDVVVYSRGASSFGPYGPVPGVSYAYVVYGAASGIPAAIDLDNLGSRGFRIAGFTDNNLRQAVSSAGDVNGDGVGDLIVGDYTSDRGGQNRGGAYVIYGNSAGFSPTLNLATINGSNGFYLQGSQDYRNVGMRVAGAGDINGDGYDDVYVSAHVNNEDGNSFAGSAYIVFGAASGIPAAVNLSALNGADGFRFSGDVANAVVGIPFAAAGDVNADGYDDFLLGRTNLNGGAGGAYLIYGRATWAASMTPAQLNATNSVIFSGDPAYRYFGGNMSTGDFNGDGRLDLAAFATTSDPSVDSNAIYVIYAPQEGLNHTGTSADELIDGTALADTLNGLGGKDTINGLGGADEIDGGDGNDIVNGDAGDDTLEGGLGNDLVNGGSGNDVITDSAGSNKLNGGDGNDIITGASGADRINGENDDDILDGGAGNDYLDGGTGANQMTGGLGNDIFIVRSAADTVIELAGQGTDTIRAMYSYTLAEGSNVEVVELLTGLALNLTGNSEANTLRGNTAANVISGLAGNDKLEGGDGADTIIGGLGRDQLYGNLANGVGDGEVDTFRFLQESVGQTPLEIDTLFDYEIGVDILDFSQIDADTRAIPAADGNQAFTLSTTGLTKVAGQAYVFYAAASDQTTVRLDVDGDGKADYQLYIKGDVTSDTADWLL